jgi:hypothetical protein
LRRFTTRAIGSYMPSIASASISVKRAFFDDLAELISRLESRDFL